MFIAAKLYIGYQSDLIKKKCIAALIEYQDSDLGVYVYFSPTAGCGF